MTTPNLNALMEQARRETHIFDRPATRRLQVLFADHGPALVAVLKILHRDISCYGDCCSEQPCGVCRAYDILTQLNQEATCQNK